MLIRRVRAGVLIPVAGMLMGRWVVGCCVRRLRSVVRVVCRDVHFGVVSGVVRDCETGIRGVRRSVGVVGVVMMLVAGQTSAFR